MTVQEIVVIADRSGSMRGKEKDTVGGINAMFDEVRSKKTEDDTIRVSLKLFDNEEILKWRCLNIAEIREFPAEEFQPRGQTALLDAMGNTLTYFMEKKLRDPNAYDTCVISVATDGLENASKYYTREKIKNLIKNAEKTYSITVVYLGANQDAILEAKNLGIGEDRAINYAENQGATEAVYRGLARVVTDSRSMPNVGFTAVERQASQQGSVPTGAPPVMRSPAGNIAAQAAVPPLAVPPVAAPPSSPVPSPPSVDRPIYNDFNISNSLLRSRTRASS